MNFIQILKKLMRRQKKGDGLMIEEQLEKSGRNESKLCTRDEFRKKSKGECSVSSQWRIELESILVPLGCCNKITETR